MSDPNLPDQVPPGLQLRQTLRGHHGVIHCLAWAPDGGSLASSSEDHAVLVWDLAAGECRHRLEGHADRVWCVAWSPDGRLLASAGFDRTVRLWDMEARGRCQVLAVNFGGVNAVAWSPDGRLLASAGYDWTIRLWDVCTGEVRQTLTGSGGAITSLAWSPDGWTLAAAVNDCGVWLWDVASGRQAGLLEGHAGPISCVSFSLGDPPLLASKSDDGTVRIWRCDTWEPATTLDEPASGDWHVGLAFHPAAPFLATLAERDTAVRVWAVDRQPLLGAPAAPAVHYRNAKVVLVGDTGVGKTGLGLVLTREPFVATESTHGRSVWTFAREEVPGGDGGSEIRETFLWDLAGQPGYRLLHQLHLGEVTLALVVFDARSETDPFAGVRYWSRALRQAQRLRGAASPPLASFLVAARADRGRLSASPARVAAAVREFGFARAFDTSAKEGWQVAELRQAVRDAIDWNALPRVTSTELLRHIRDFLLASKEAGRLLLRGDDLYRDFLLTAPAAGRSNLRAEFDTAAARLEARGLVRRLSFGSLILLQPELLDAYASAMIHAAKDEPEGLGLLLEEGAREGRFRMPQGNRLQDREQERLLLLATIEDLLRHDIALREIVDERPYLVFPSQVTQEHPDLPDPEGKAVVFRFEGPVANVYVTLVVRLSRSGPFTKQNLWRNAAAYSTPEGDTCGLSIREVEEGRGELTLFFDAAAGPDRRAKFTEYVRTHLQARALPESVSCHPIITCPACGEAITEEQARRRRERGHRVINCPVCETALPLPDDAAGGGPTAAAVSAMDRRADRQRDQAADATVLEAKKTLADFEVLLCCTETDLAAVAALSERLQGFGVLPLLAGQPPETRPPRTGPSELPPSLKAAVACLGPAHPGLPQDRETWELLRRLLEKRMPVILALLPGWQDERGVPEHLRDCPVVDLRRTDPGPVRELARRITGKPFAGPPGL